MLLLTMLPRRHCRGLVLSALTCLAAATAPAPQAWAQAPAPAVPVTLTKVARADVPVMLKALGQVLAMNNIVIRTRVDGTLDKILFTEGDVVKAGTLLAVIDPRPYQAVLDQALAKKATDEANLVNARLNLGRSSQLARNQFETQATVDANTSLVAQLTATIKGDEAAIAAARLNLEFTQITAPFDGRLGLRLTDLGSFIRAADNTNPGIVTMSQIQPISMVFTLPQDNLPAITAAMARGRPKVIAVTPDESRVLDTGELLTIDNAIDATTGTIKMKATFANAKSTLWPGQFVNAKLMVDQRKGALTLPSAAVQRGPQGMFVYSVKPDQTVQVRPVEVAQDSGGVAVIGKGVDDGETVVLSGQSRLSNGAHIVAAPAPAAS